MAESNQIQLSDVREALNMIGPASWLDLVHYLDTGKGRGGQRLRRMLKSLSRSGEIELVARGTYQITDNGIVRQSGTIVMRSGKLGVLLDKGEWFLLRSPKGVRAGDRVEWYVKDQMAEVDRVVKATEEPFVGIYRRGRKSAYIEPITRGLGPSIDLITIFKEAHDGDVVEAVMCDAYRGRTRAKVIEVIRQSSECARAAETMLRSFDVPCLWPTQFTSIDVDQNVLEVDKAGRSDFRNTPFVTIDGADARDYDDAVYAEAHKEGWHLKVAIADVAHYVKPETDLDREALARGNSVYLPDRVIPMLPESLSNGICSLVPQEDRLALVCEMTISENGELLQYGFVEGVIRSHERLTYTEVASFLELPEENWSEAVRNSLDNLYKTYKALRLAREARGALDFESRETGILIKDGQPVSVSPRYRNEAHCLIEEAMLVANVACASFLEGHDTALMYRIHASPQDTKLNDLRDVLRWAGISVGTEIKSPKDLQTLLDSTKSSRVPQWIWHMLALRSMEQACYVPDNIGHFGLALPSYAHFTSPIRRYADLLNHRLIKGHLHKSEGHVGYDETQLLEIGSHISMTERRAEDTSRSVDAWLKSFLIEERIGELFRGTVVSVTGFGLFVELDETYVQGLLHISNLGDEYYEWRPQSLSLVAERSGARFSLGQELDVVLQEVSVETGKVDLILPPKKKGVAPKRRVYKNSKRKNYRKKRT